MDYEAQIRMTVPCPHCHALNEVRFRVLDLVTKDDCRHCGHVVVFRRPYRLDLSK